MATSGRWWVGRPETDQIKNQLLGWISNKIEVHAR
jgi:hypothetical protein